MSAARRVEWAYGLTTVPSRRDDLLPATLLSLCEAGFPSPRLFVDGIGGSSCKSADWYRVRFGTDVTARETAAGCLGNWWLGLQELYARRPFADRYAMFQDDLTAVSNLRAYLDATAPPFADGYLNLFTFRDNEAVVAGRPVGWYEAARLSPRTDDPKQTGRGALGLVFDSAGVRTLLSSRMMIEKPRAADRKIARQRIDGGVVAAMNAAGYREYVHSPSLLQHSGVYSSIGNHNQPRALSFPGESFDALKWAAGRGET